MMGNEPSIRNTDRDWDNRSDLPGLKPMGENGLGRNPVEQLAPLAMRKRYDREQKIYCQEEAAEYWYHVVSGVLRRSVIWPDGRRQIMDFLLPGDFCGFAGGDEHHFFTVEAVVADTVVACYPRLRAERLADNDPDLARFIRQKAFDGSLRLQAQIRILGRTRAPEKLASFLLEMAHRCARAPDNQIVLPMSRYDIADYLAVSTETVCRAMTRLKARGAIALEGTRAVTIINHTMLERGDE